MKECNSSYDCGCILVHYGRDELKLPGHWECGYSGIVTDENVEFDSDTNLLIWNLCGVNPTNYKQVKDFLKFQ